MKDKNTLQTVLLYLGCALLLISLIFFIISVIEYNTIPVNTEDTVCFIESVIPDRTAGIKEERSNCEMPSVTFGGQDYAALLTVPRFSVKLPIRTSWDKNVVRKVPCCFTGSVYDGTFTVGGIDAEGQFDFVSKIDIGDTVVVTDMKGSEFTYIVSTVKHAKNSKASTLIDDNFDLTFFAKDKKTGDWLLVRCNMK